MKKKDVKCPVPEVAQIGQYRDEKTKFKNMNYTKSILEVDRRNIQYEHTSLDWSVYESDKVQDLFYGLILNYNRVFLQGGAGYGKTWLINLARKELGDTFLYTSFTHTAANNIDGKTLHNVFGVNIMTEACNPGKFVKMCKNYKGIVIDEINMCPRSILRLLIQLPKDFKIYCFGDTRQELPVNETHQLIDTEMFKQIMRGNKIVLNKQYRADPEYAATCAEYHDLLEQKKTEDANQLIYSMVKSTKLNTIQHDFNIVKTNLCRCYINEQKMLEYKPEGCPIIEPIDNSDSQPMHLYKGLPLICNFTLGNKFSTYTAWYNGEYTHC